MPVLAASQYRLHRASCLRALVWWTNPTCCPIAPGIRGQQHACCEKGLTRPSTALFRSSYRRFPRAYSTLSLAVTAAVVMLPDASARRASGAFGLLRIGIVARI